jgi:hypothetical protein
MRVLAKALSAMAGAATLIASAPVPPSACSAERAALAAERAAVERAISDIALGGKARARVSGGDVARHAAGTAASILLPFGIGIAVNAAAAAAARAGKKGKKAEAPAPDAAALIARADAIDARLAEIGACS